jgi:ankyrin repeat protein
MGATEVNANDAYGATALHIACSQTATKNDRVLEEVGRFLMLIAKTPLNRNFAAVVGGRRHRCVRCQS